MADPAYCNDFCRGPVAVDVCFETCRKLIGPTTNAGLLKNGYVLNPLLDGPARLLKNLSSIWARPFAR